MTEQIVCRPFQSQDAPALEDIIRKTWRYDELCSPRTARRLAKAYLSNCLSNQTFTQVAVANGTPVGIIMGKNRRRRQCPLRAHLRAGFANLSLFLSKEGRAVSKIFSGVDAIDQELLEKRHKEYGGEIAFFALDPCRRGKGLGKALFRALLHYMKEEDIQDFFLFTDTSCNYGFYEHQGMVRCGEKSRAFDIGGRHSEMTFFIYEFQFKEG